MNDGASQPSPAVHRCGQSAGRRARPPIYAAAQGGNGHMIVHADVMEYAKRPVVLEGVPDRATAFSSSATAWCRPIGEATWR